MAESVFEAVKQSITVREAAQMYGIEVNRSGMACCPFHDDKNPSMKLNEEYFYCFGCGATGDVIDFTARLYNLSPKEAAEKLAQDFGLAYDSQAPPRRCYVRQKTEAQKFKEDRDHAFRVLADYYHLLRKWEMDYSPKTPEENPHPRFMEAIQKKDYTGYLLDFFLEDGPEEQKLWIAEHQSEIANLERRVKFMADKPTNRERLQEITAGIEQGIKELFESEKYMRYLSVMSKFHRYSVNNTMLIYMQRPDATLVAGFNKWKNQFSRHVKKGEHGISEHFIKPELFAQINGKLVVTTMQEKSDSFNLQPQIDSVPIYSHTASYAREHNELDAYRASLNANLQCKEAIEAAVREHFDGMYLSHDAARGVIETYGMERVMLVLANTVQLQNWDGRYSPRNKEWAKTIPNYNSDTVRVGYAVNSHPAVLNGFIDLVREEYLRRQPLTAEDIQAEAERILRELRAPDVPNSPHGTHYMARISQEFLNRAGSKDHDRLMNLLPFRSLAFTGMKGLPGTYATILASEDRSKELRQPRPSIREHLKQEPKQAAPKAPGHKKREPER